MMTIDKETNIAVFDTALIIFYQKKLLVDYVLIGWNLIENRE